MLNGEINLLQWGKKGIIYQIIIVNIAVHSHTHTHTQRFMTGKGKWISWQPLLQTLGSAQHLWDSSSEVSLGITDWDAVGTELEGFLKQSHIAFLSLPT